MPLDQGAGGEASQEFPLRLPRWEPGDRVRMGAEARAATQRASPAASSDFQNGALVFSQSIKNSQDSMTAFRWAEAVSTKTI